jgi:predicted nucleic acid-binding Zn ribbon protein
MRKAGDIISGLFKQRFGEGFMENARSSAELFNSWEKTVCQVWQRGENQKSEDIPAAAVHSRIKELERGVLLVEADHPGWIQILQTRQAELLLAIQRRCPGLDIRGIAFRLSRN